MVWVVQHHLPIAGRRRRLWGGALLFWVCFMVVAPKIPHSPNHHFFADMRNLFGVPYTLNVISVFPFLIVGVLGLVLCLQGSFFVISLRGEIWCWALFYAGIAAVAFGSAYYHLKPDDNRLIWDRLPMMIVFTSLLSSFTIERMGARIGLTCLFLLLLIGFISISYERTFNDLRLFIMFQMVHYIAFPVMAFTYPPKYTHSRYWLWASGFYLLAKFDSIADGKIYRANHYIISGHSLEHLCLVMVPFLLTLMLMFRSIKMPRWSENLRHQKTCYKAVQLANRAQSLNPNYTPVSSRLGELKGRP